MFDEKNIKKVIGVKQSTKALRTINDLVRVTVCVARDAEQKVVQPLLDLAKEREAKIQYVDTMKKLGQLCDIDVGAAAALIFED